MTAPPELPDAVWEAILDDLADRVGKTEDVEIVSSEAVTWNDGSLGCPQPGQMYTQALVDGYRVILEVDGERYDYHVGDGTNLTLCETGPPRGG